VIKQRQSGITMLETLIAILVLSLGMFGMLSMFLISLKLTSSSNYRTIAAQQSYAIADSIRASMPQLTVYPGAAGAAVANCLTATGCTGTEIVDTEIALWKARLTAMLPAGDGTVCRDASPGDGTPGAWGCDGTGQFVVKVCWDDSRVPTSSLIECVVTTL
jgi:type IV pilus assembly protein PilV